MTGPTRLSLPRALARFEQRRAAAGLAPATRSLDASVLQRLLPRLRRPLARVRRPHLELLFARRLEEVSAATAARELSTLRAFWAHLLREGWAQQDPTRGLAIRQAAPRRLFLSEAEVEDLLRESSRLQPSRRSRALRAALALRNRALIELLYGVGLRASEAAQLRLLQLDLVERTLRFERAKRGPPGALPVSPAAAEHLALYVREGRPVLAETHGAAPSGRLLLGERGAPLKAPYLGSLVSRIAQRAGLRAHPHALRRTLATHLVRQGATLPAVQHLLGHAELDTTARYVDVDLPALRRAIACFGGGSPQEPGSGALAPAP